MIPPTAMPGRASDVARRHSEAAAASAAQAPSSSVVASVSDSVRNRGSAVACTGGRIAGSPVGGAFAVMQDIAGVRRMGASSSRACRAFKGLASDDAVPGRTALDRAAVPTAAPASATLAGRRRTCRAGSELPAAALSQRGRALTTPLAVHTPLHSMRPVDRSSSTMPACSGNQRAQRTPALRRNWPR